MILARRGLLPLFFSSAVMTNAIFDQNQILNPATTIRWDEPSRGAIASDSIPASDNGVDGMSEYISFSIDSYLSDEEDFFGVCIGKYRLTATREITYDNSPDFGPRSTFFLGGDFPDREAAQVYAQYVLWSWRQTGNFRLCPVCEIEE